MPSNSQNEEKLQLERINKILSIKDKKDERISSRNFEKFVEYLNENIDKSELVTPTEMLSWEEEYFLGDGSQKEYEKLKKTQPCHTDKFKIVDIVDYDDDYGILVNVRRVPDRRKFVFPLFELEPVDENSKNYQLIDDYQTWFANSMQ